MTKRRICIPLAAMLTVLPFSQALVAQAIADPQVQALMKRVQELERSLAEVKAALSNVAPPAAAVQPATAPTPFPPAPDPAPVQTALTHEPDPHTLGPLEFRGFSDFGYGRALFEEQPPGGLAHSPLGFTLGDFDLFSSAQLSPKLSMLGEVLVSSDFSNTFGSEIDRLMLTYAFSDYLKISAGKYNTAIGFYTNAFHLAKFFQTATGRPLLFADEDTGGILPVHSIGLSATGKIPSGVLGLHWVAEIANGRAAPNPAAPQIQNFADQNNGKASNFALYARPRALQGLQVGGSMYRDRLYPVGKSPLNQRIYSAYATIVRPHMEILVEGVLLRHEIAATGRMFNTTSSYVQYSRQYGHIRPFVRYDYQNAPERDPLFSALGRQNGPSFGTRFDLSDYSVFKIQFGRLSLRDGTTTNDFQAQVAFAF